jgi:P4 family phage/plasmid primase-like protien
MDLTDTLSPEHLREVTHDSAVSPETAAARGYRTLTGHTDERQLLEDIGFKPYVWNRDDAYPGLLIPMHGMDGTVRGHQFKPAVPRVRMKADGTPSLIKYESPSKAPLVVDVPAATRERLAATDETASLWITEGMKKTDCLVSQGMAAVGLTGVFNWRNSYGTLGDWEDIPLKGRPVVVCFDSDAAGNRNVQLAMGRLGAWLRTRGVSAVHYLVVPAEVDGVPVKGVDDFFAAGGTMEVLAAAAVQTPPGAGEKDASFTDAFLVEELAEALEGRFCWASGLGWLRWNGRIWKDVSDVEPLEAVRVWASEQYDQALVRQRQDLAKDMRGQIAGWRAVLGRSRLTALRDLAKGLVQRDAAEFDGDPDLLTVLNGTLHLPSGKLLPFDPSHHITKSADADYRPAAVHPMWTKALEAIPADMREWYQDRLGQALTGYPVPDHTLVIAHGTGSNGKSTIVNTVRRTVGDYGVVISDRVLMASADAHPTELMDLRGARYAVMEETPEARHLNVQRLKITLGSESIKARRIRQDPVEFLTSHSLFINTNYRPVVTETDWGTWRRLSLMPFPYTFKKPSAALESSRDRTGDPKLAYAQNDPQVRTACLAWMAAGARAWYARGRMMLPSPERVEKETREWRAETDLILGFSDECLRFDPDAFTQTRDMLAAFNEWAGERGHRPWNDRTFATRFGDHDTIRGAKVKQGRFTVRGKQQRGWSGVEINTDGQDPFSGERDLPEPPEPDEWEQGVPPGLETAAAVHGMYQAAEQGRVIESSTDLDSLPDPEEWSEVVHEGDVIGYTQPESAEPVALGFDLETAGVETLFKGGHEGPFVRIAGWKSDASEGIVADPEAVISLARSADVIYGHNVLGFDLLALARHHGADYDALAAKSVDTMVLAQLLDPPLSKGMPSGYYSLDGVAKRLGVQGKTDDIKALAREHGGFDKIPLDDADYHAYLRGDLAAGEAVHTALTEELAERPEAQQLYARREMEVVALQNRPTLNGWAIDTELLAERVRQEDDQREAAKAELNAKYGVPLNYPDKIKLKPKPEWPEACRSIAITDARVMLRDRPEECLELGMAVREPGEPRKKPWASDAGREAIVAAAASLGAEYWPHSLAGTPLTSSDALGDKEWYDAERKDTRPGLLQVYGHIPEVRALADTLALATGARVKYAEFAAHLTPAGRVHPSVGTLQGSSRWAYVKPSTSTTGKRGAAAAERDVLVADDGHLMLTSDHSQLDVRTVAALSQDQELIAMLQPDADDYHETMAEVYFGDRGRRSDAKPINHGVNYGQGFKAIAKRNGLDEEMVRLALEARGDRFRDLMVWTERVREQAGAGMLLDNGFGRLMRPSPERAFTQAPALMGQGASRDVMCESLLRLDRISERRVRPFLRGVIHDEIVLSVPEGETAEWQEMLREAMTWEWKGVPILCEVSKPAYRWSECK